MTKQEAMRRTMMNDNLRRLGFTSDECDQLRRISLTLQHWGERECNEDIETRADGTAWVTPHYGITGPGRAYQIPNREAGALCRLAAIMKSRARKLTYYHQTDPRGAALYIIERKRYNDFKAQHLARKGAQSDSGDRCGLDICYSSIGIAVY